MSMVGMAESRGLPAKRIFRIKWIIDREEIGLAAETCVGDGSKDGGWSNSGMTEWRHV